MSRDPTPGQVAYEAAWRVHEELYPKAHRTPWRELHPAHKRGWEAAAQAAIVHHEEQIQLRASLMVSNAHHGGSANGA